MEWSDWYNLKILDHTMISANSGLYQIRWAPKGEPQSINRANGVDDSGLLYIGKSKNLNSRIEALHRGINQYIDMKSAICTHTAIYTYTYYNFEKKFKPEQLEIRWAALSENEIDGWEVNFIGDYVERFLDKPPLNISIRRL